MKHIARILLLSLVVAFASYTQTPSLQRNLKLPIKVQSALSKEFGHWAYADIGIPLYDRQGRQSGHALADLISGDFNGDNCLDYAGIFALLDSTNAPLFLIALLCQDSTYLCYVLDVGSRDIPTVVDLIPKGLVEKDLESGDTYKHPYDAIGWGYYEKAGGTYYYRDGRFRYITTGD